jgi:hypothetical protein
MFQAAPMQFNNAPEGKSGAITFIFPGSAFMFDSPQRYCPQGQVPTPCVAPEDLAYNATTNPLGTKITNIRQLASAGWYIRGSLANLDVGFILSEYMPEGKSYRVGAYLITGENEEAWSPYDDPPGTFLSAWSFTYNQLNVQGLVFAKYFELTGQFYQKDPASGALIEPSENFVYDGRAVANPPPGFGDLVAGLPKIQQATP